MLKRFVSPMFVLLSATALAQQTTTKDSTAMAIVQKSLAAKGSGQVFTDVQAVGTTTAYSDMLESSSCRIWKTRKRRAYQAANSI